MTNRVRTIHRHTRIAQLWASVLLLAVVATYASNVPARTLNEIQQRGVLRIGVNPNFPSNSYYGPTNQLQGFDIDVGRELARALRVRPQFIPTETALRVPFLASGRIDISLGALTRTPAREKLIDFTIPLHTEAMGVLTTDKVIVRTWRDLNDPKFTLVNMRGNSSVPFTREQLPKAHLLLVDGNADTIRSIAQGRADAIVENVTFFMAFTKAYPDIHWRVLPDAIQVAYCGIGVEKGNDGLRAALNDTLAHLHRTGFINASWTRWYDTPMQGVIDVDAELTHSRSALTSNAGVAHP